MMPESLNRPIFATGKVRFVGDIVAAVVAETARAGRRRRRAGRRRLRPVAGRSLTPPTRWRPTRRCCSPSTARTCASAPTFPRGGRRRPARGRRRRRRGHHGEPAPRRRADGEQRHPRRARATAASRCWVSHQAPHSIHGAYAPMLGLDPAKLRVVCPWVGGGFGPKAGPYVEHLVAAAAALKLGKPGEVGRDPLRGHGLAGARPRLRDDGQARRGQPTARSSASTASVVASAGAYPALGAILPMLTQMMSVGVYEIPNVRFKATDGVDQQHHRRRLPRRRAARGDAADRACARRRRRQDRHGPGRDPPGELHPARQVPAHHDHRRATTTRASTRRPSTPR